MDVELQPPSTLRSIVYKSVPNHDRDDGAPLKQESKAMSSKAVSDSSVSQRSILNPLSKLFRKSHVDSQ